jgi:hypothetical protein
MTPPPRWVLLLAGLLPAAAGAAAAVRYDSPLLMLFVLVAAALAGSVPVLLSRAAPTAAAPGALLALVVLIAGLLVTVNGGTSPGAAAQQLTGALARLLSFAPPIPTRADTLTPVVVAVWAAAFVAAALAARGWRLLAVVPSVVVLVAALLLVGRSAPAPGWVAPVVGLGPVLLTLGGRATRRTAVPATQGSSDSAARRARRLRTWASAVIGAVVAVLVIALGIGAAQALSGTSRVDAQARYQPPQDRPEPIDPLTRLAGWAKGDTQVLADVRISATLGASTSAPTAWRWAVLDQFDGARWTSAQRYRPTGQRMRTTTGADAVAARAGTLNTVRASVTVSPVLEPWLPSPGQVRQVSGPSVAVDPYHDSIMQAVPSDAEQSYGLVADTVPLDPTNPQDQAIVAGFRAGDPGTGDQALTAPGLPPELRTIALSFAPGPGKTDGQRALALQALLQNGEFVSDAPSGHLYVRLKQFFDDSAPDGYLRGTSEQFATAFAVLARSVGLPTRIVIGFQIPSANGADVPVQGKDMRAWPEVYFAGQGWVRFEPTPKDRGASAPKTPPKLKELIPQNPQQAQPAPASVSGSGGTQKGPRHQPGGGVAVLAMFVAIAGGVALLGILALIGLAGFRIRQSSRRRRGPEPNGRVIGAWQHLEDAVLLSGAARAGAARSPSDHSASAVAELVRGRTGGPVEPLAELARIANLSAFGPDGSVRDADADRAWSISDEAAADLRRGAGRRRRLIWWFDPKPLRRRQ